MEGRRKDRGWFGKCGGNAGLAGAALYEEKWSVQRDLFFSLVNFPSTRYLGTSLAGRQEVFSEWEKQLARHYTEQSSLSSLQHLAAATIVAKLLSVPAGSAPSTPCHSRKERGKTAVRLYSVSEKQLHSPDPDHQHHLAFTALSCYRTNAQHEEAANFLLLGRLIDWKCLGKDLVQRTSLRHGQRVKLDHNAYRPPPNHLDPPGKIVAYSS